MPWANSFASLTQIAMQSTNPQNSECTQDAAPYQSFCNAIERVQYEAKVTQALVARVAERLKRTSDAQKLPRLLLWTLVYVCPLAVDLHAYDHETMSTSESIPLCIQRKIRQYS